MSSTDELPADVHVEVDTDSSAKQCYEHSEPKISTPPSDIEQIAEDDSDGAVFVEEKCITEEKDSDGVVFVEEKSITEEKDSDGVVFVEEKIITEEKGSDDAVLIEEKSITQEKGSDDAVLIEEKSITPEIEEYELSESDEYEFDTEDEPGNTYESESSEESNFDDESTIEEEEMVADRDEIADEVARLQDEQDLPIEELLKNYGGVLYPNHPLSKDSQKDYATDSMVNDYFTNPDALCASDEDDKEYVSDATWKSEIRTGPECQAEIPDMEVNEPVAREEILISKPSPEMDCFESFYEEMANWVNKTLTAKLSFEYVLEVYNEVKWNKDMTKSKIEREISLALEKMNGVETIGNHVLMLLCARGTFREKPWSISDVTIFEDGFTKFSRDFHKIRLQFQHRTTTEVVNFYHVWVQSDQYIAFKRRMLDFINTQSISDSMGMENVGAESENSRQQSTSAEEGSDPSMTQSI
ncbi:Metastasis-associated protein MTA3 [Trichinella pseudospiralis]|uniref:Metastasis-associated protein MTA3 n=2 Tax=Trichinella pseudospiralis TaxID=6337 RepID=A0A0V1IG28_TRIPS|nr:Metastasis-associated protein MTA3 [Trichinella pseudospiralis]